MDNVLIFKSRTYIPTVYTGTECLNNTMDKIDIYSLGIDELKEVTKIINKELFLLAETPTQPVLE